MPVASLAVDTSALTDLRRTRRTRRLGDTEWFDIAYNVYLAAILGGGAIIVASGYIGDTPLGDDAVRRFLDRAPAYLGVILAVAVGVGLRSGAGGGPLSVESADARHLLLAPISRRAVLRQPFLQRLRTVTGGAALVGGIAGLLSAQRLPGSASAWTLSGAAFGACVGMITVVVAVHAHAVRLPGWVAVAVGGAVCGWQVLAAVGHHTGPLNSLGDIALWGNRPVPVDLVGVGVVVAVAVVAMFDVGRLSVEHLDRRGDLVSQLRFAVTTQDLRTVVLLRRQLRQERPRDRPLVVVPATDGGPSSAVIRRSVHSLLRMPLARLGRVVALCAAAGVAAGMAARGTTPAVVVCGILLFIMGLDLIEPLSQEIDHPDRADDLPVEPGWLHLRLLVGPVVVAVVPAMAGAAACAVVEPRATVAALAFAVPVTWSGMTGSIVNALRDDVLTGPSESILMPPEVSGVTDVVRLLLPLVMSTLGSLSILALRAEPTVGTAVRLEVAIGGGLAAFGWWVRKRADLRRAWSTMKAEAMP